MPLTLCLVVLARYVDRLEFLDVLLGDRPALSPAESFYQRVLAGDADEAQDQAELLHPIDFGCYFEGNTCCSCDLNGSFWAFLRGDATKKCKIATFGMEAWFEIGDGEPMVNRCGEISVWNRYSLAMGNGDQTHFVKTSANRLVMRDILSAVKSGQDAGCYVPERAESVNIQMEMQNIKFVCLFQSILLCRCFAMV